VSDDVGSLRKWRIGQAATNVGRQLCYFQEVNSIADQIEGGHGMPVRLKGADKLTVAWAARLKKMTR
jgi:hypothetical protein